MTDKQTHDAAAGSNVEKDPNDWVTGDEPMTGAQKSYLKTLSEQAKAPFDDSLTKAQASQRIEELQQLTGRGTAASQHNRTLTTESSAGEEDPAASVSERSTRQAMQGGSTDSVNSTIGDRRAAEQTERSRLALENVTEGYGGRDSHESGQDSPTTSKPHRGTGSDAT